MRGILGRPRADQVAGPDRRPWALAAALSFWAVAVLAGFFILEDYRQTEGPLGTAPDWWPPETSFEKDSALPTLLFFVHPRCSCSRASIDELNRVLANATSEVRANVVFVRPGGLEPESVRGALWEVAERLPGLRMCVDEHGREAVVFGAKTSGHFFLYDPSGELRFHGGITPARGHTGSNGGSAALEALLQGRSPPVKTHPVFGCPLFAPFDGACTSDVACPCCRK